MVICRSVKVLREHHEVLCQSTREYGSDVNPEFLHQGLRQFSNLRIIRTWDAEPLDAIIESFECNGNRILIERPCPFTIPLGWKRNHDSAGGMACCCSLHSIRVLGHSYGPALANSLKALIAETQGVSKEITFAGPLGQLRSLTFLPEEESNSALSLSELDAVLDACPELYLLACRLEGSAAILANEETLDRTFAKGKDIERISIDTPGDLVPYLRCLSRFQDVTLTCELRLRESDMAMLESRVVTVLPCIPQTKSFTVASTIGSLSFLLYAQQPALPVAQVIQFLLPPDCRVTAEPSPQVGLENYTQSMLDWWWELSTTLEEFEKARLETRSRSPARLFVPMTQEETAKVLQSNGR